MNIQDRIAKLETQICQSIDELTKLKEEVSLEKVDDSWKPRVGEIVEMSDDGDYWLLRRYEDDGDFGFMDTFGESWENCRPLNDPMVIQLIPHVPGDEMPCDFDSDVIVLHGNDFSKRYYTVDSAKNISWDRFDSNDDVFGWKHLNED